MAFHEEATFKWLKDLECDPETKEVEDPISKDHDDDSSPSNVQRENPIEHVELPVINEQIELVDEPP